MQSKIELNRQLLIKKLNNNDYIYCVEELKDKFKLKQINSKYKTDYPTKESINTIEEILTQILSLKRNDTYSVAKQCFQSLRNCVTYDTNVQDYVVIDTNLIQITYNFIQNVFDQTDTESTECLKMQLQFLCNLTVSNPDAQIVIWNKFNTILRTALKRNDVVNVVTLILYNIFKVNEILIPNELQFTIDVIERCENENVPFLFELLITKNIITKQYNQFDTSHRIKILDLIYNIMLENIEIPFELIQKLMDVFKENSHFIFDTKQDVNPIEVSKLLECIACVSSNELSLLKMQDDTNLFQHCVLLLKTVHQLSKQDGNPFTAIQKLSELVNTSEAIREHPVYGFKVDLIRLLGNFTCKNKKYQDLIRQNDCIELLLDCCNIDARNPLIIQWVILAMRNLCEENSENQLVISQLTKVGVVDSKMLNDFGFTLHDNGDASIGIIPLKSEIKK